MSERPTCEEQLILLRRAIRNIDDAIPGEDAEDSDYEFGWLVGIQLSIQAFIDKRLGKLAAKQARPMEEV